MQDHNTVTELAPQSTQLLQNNFGLVFPTRIVVAITFSMSREKLMQHNCCFSCHEQCANDLMFLLQWLDQRSSNVWFKQNSGCNYVRCWSSLCCNGSHLLYTASQGMLRLQSALHNGSNLVYTQCTLFNVHSLGELGLAACALVSCFVLSLCILMAHRLKYFITPSMTPPP